jgi:hypothetical protein
MRVNDAFKERTVIKGRYESGDCVCVCVQVVASSALTIKRRLRGSRPVQLKSRSVVNESSM